MATLTVVHVNPETGEALEDRGFSASFSPRGIEMRGDPDGRGRIEISFGTGYATLLFTQDEFIQILASQMSTIPGAEGILRDVLGLGEVSPEKVL